MFLLVGFDKVVPWRLALRKDFPIYGVRTTDVVGWNSPHIRPTSHRCRQPSS